MYNILVCDDEKDIVAALEIYLTAQQYKVFCGYTGEDALRIVEQEEVHLILLDVMMPKMDGITALEKIREHHNMPIILLTAKSEETDKILGLTVGADDYVTKPFLPMEVIARVKSQLRRYMQLGGNQQKEHQLTIGGISLNDEAKEVTMDGEAVSLTPIEYSILKLFMEHPDKVFSPREIYSKVWKEAFVGAESTVAVHIRHLREKIEINPKEPRYLKVVWGKGYKMESGLNERK